MALLIGSGDRLIVGGNEQVRGVPTATVAVDSRGHVAPVRFAEVGAYVTPVEFLEVDDGG